MAMTDNQLSQIAAKLTALLARFVDGYLRQTGIAKVQPLDQDKAISAVLALLVAQREERLAGDGAEPRKTEALLASVGMTAAEIAPLVAKTTDAVTKTIQRSRKSKTGSAKKGP